jgi:signal peptidase II
MSSPTLPTALNVPAKSKPDSTAAPVTSLDGEQSASRSVRWALFLSLAIGGVAADLVSKHLIFAWRGWEQFGDPFWLVDGIFGIETSVNHGALFGLGAGYRLGFVLLSIVALGVIGYFVAFRPRSLDLWLTTALGLVTGGILGNLYDRLGLWHAADTPAFARFGVRDWILFRLEGVRMFDPWPNFNIADCCLVVGACLLAAHSFFGPREAKSAEEAKRESSGKR